MPRLDAAPARSRSAQNRSARPPVARVGRAPQSAVARGVCSPWRLGLAVGGWRGAPNSNKLLNVF